jgi:hypothetical protein
MIHDVYDKGEIFNACCIIMYVSNLRDRGSSFRGYFTADIGYQQA